MAHATPPGNPKMFPVIARLLAQSLITRSATLNTAAWGTKFNISSAVRTPFKHRTSGRSSRGVSSCPTSTCPWESVRHWQPDRRASRYRYRVFQRDNWRVSFRLWRQIFNSTFRGHFVENFGHVLEEVITGDVAWTYDQRINIGARSDYTKLKASKCLNLATCSVDSVLA